MVRWLSTLSLNQKLAVAAVVLGAVALAATLVPWGGRVTLSARELAWRSAGRPTTWRRRNWRRGSWRGEGDYRLIDLLFQAEYALYHIPGASREPAAGGLDGRRAGTAAAAALDGRRRNRLGQAWMLLRAEGFGCLHAEGRVWRSGGTRFSGRCWPTTPPSTSAPVTSAAAC